MIDTMKVNFYEFTSASWIVNRSPYDVTKAQRIPDIVSHPYLSVQAVCAVMVAM